VPRSTSVAAPVRNSSSAWIGRRRVSRADQRAPSFQQWARLAGHAVDIRAGDRASRTDSGAGLGLAVARTIVETHGGRIWIADSGSGSRVRFSLPTSIF
jgi:hypothetical protein